MQGKALWARPGGMVSARANPSKWPAADGCACVCRVVPSQLDALTQGMLPFDFNLQCVGGLGTSSYPAERIGDTGPWWCRWKPNKEQVLQWPLSWWKPQSCQLWGGTAVFGWSVFWPFFKDSQSAEKVAFSLLFAWQHHTT